jgi:AcrR family transcriptional regulator
MRPGRINSIISIMRRHRIIIAPSDAIWSPRSYAGRVSRWAPGARERLESAALDLFVEHGYEETTVAQIADRAGLNRATFFRHFADKREVLFGGEDVLAGLFAQGISSASPDATLTECLQGAFVVAEVAMTSQQRAKATQRVLVAAANREVQERGLLKHARIASSISAALRERGADQLTARLGAEVGMLAFSVAVERWIGSDTDEPFLVHAITALSDLRLRAAELDSQVLPVTAARFRTSARVSPGSGSA